MKISASAYSLIGVIIISFIFIGLSLQLSAFSSKLLPLIFSGLAIFLAAIKLGTELRNKDKASERGKSEPETGETVDGTNRNYLMAAIWIIGYFIGFFLFGFTVATAVFMLSYLKTHKTRWSIAIIITVITCGSIYSLFALLLRVELYQGWLLSMVFG